MGSQSPSRSGPSAPPPAPPEPLLLDEPLSGFTTSSPQPAARARGRARASREARGRMARDATRERLLRGDLEHAGEELLEPDLAVELLRAAALPGDLAVVDAAVQADEELGHL